MDIPFMVHAYYIARIAHILCRLCIIYGCIRVVYGPVRDDDVNA